MKNHIKVSLLVLSSLCIGVLIYTFTRTDSIYLNQWLASLGGSSTKAAIQNLMSPDSLPTWVVYSLPDGLWMMALTMLILLVWNFQLHKHSLAMLILAMFTGIFFEIGQGLSIIKGTFDPFDLITICMGALIPILFTLLKSSVWKVKQNQFYP